MRQFTISEEGIKNIRRKTQIKSIPLFALATMTIVYFCFSDVHHSDNNFLYSFIFIFVILFAFRLRRVIKRQLLQSRSFIVSLNSNSITRKIDNTADITIYFYNISAIVKLPNGNLMIKGEDKKVINIPVEIENYPDLMASLELIKPITNGDRPFYQKNSGVVALVGLIALIILFETKSRFWLIISSCAVISILTLGIYRIQTNPDIDVRAKRRPWMSLFLITVIALYVILRLMQGF